MVESCLVAMQWGILANRLPAAWWWTFCIALLAYTCCAHFAYFNALHVQQLRYHCRAKGI